jgi:5-methylcytosine-specific restriction endonuclease McrA
MVTCKTCSKCCIEKPLGEFHRQAGCKQGVRPECKACFYAANRSRYSDQERKEQRRRHREKHRDELIARDRAYYEKNKARLNAWQTEYNRTNREAYLAKMRAWRKANPEKVQVWVRNRRAKLKGLAGKHTIDDVRALLSSQQGMCVYCKSDIRKQFQVDHIMPVSLGGSNSRSNLQLLCKQCNLDKRAKRPEEFARERGLLI